MALDDGDAFRARRARRASAGTDCGVTHSFCDLSGYSRHGFYKPISSKLACGETAWSESGAGMCTRCPGNSHILPTADAHDGEGLCVCDAGFYATEWPLKRSCRGCPMGIYI